LSVTIRLAAENPTARETKFIHRTPAVNIVGTFAILYWLDFSFADFRLKVNHFRRDDK
jgi:hypothetical protein